MNTDPLPSITYQPNSNLSSKTINDEMNWRELILKQDVESIWRRLAGLAQSQDDDEWSMGDKTQDVFLRLLNGRRFNTYVDENWSEEQITGELLSLIRRQAEA
ncbi:MAG TPA: hypothetical protein VNI02_05050 [Blastocatellia bacterium]|jgi:hypothetical protein|nr:hypothetical protein [Blastocatellia bacterium]